jgi:L-seryl-tRNA(Ser) seleniumtransferase
LAAYSLEIRVAASQRAIAQLRKHILAKEEVDLGSASEMALEIARHLTVGTLPAAINMSGVILHTGLGRARLATSVAEAIREAAADACAVELDLDTGGRGDRQSLVRDMLCHLTGAEDALVVNNAAGALVLSLRALAFGKDVLLSRGQMVEIGGSFRVPDIVKESGCRLVEVGTTNRTHLKDYRVNAETGAILVCHRSNFDVVGFVTEPSIEELCGLGVPVVDDMGTGCLANLERFGLPKAKTLADSVSAGTHLAIGSGDKLLGGPQAGLIVGRRELVSSIRSHPMARAFRVDKLTLAGLRATLALYVTGRELEIPTIRYLARTLEEVKSLADSLARGIGKDTRVEASHCEFGGGSGPGMAMPSYRVGIESRNPEVLAHCLRMAKPAVIGRIEKGTFWLDPRTAETQEVDKAISIVRECLR